MNSLIVTPVTVACLAILFLILHSRNSVNKIKNTIKEKAIWLKNGAPVDVWAETSPSTEQEVGSSFEHKMYSTWRPFRDVGLGLIALWLLEMIPTFPAWLLWPLAGTLLLGCAFDDFGRLSFASPTWHTRRSSATLLTPLFFLLAGGALFFLSTTFARLS